MPPGPPPAGPACGFFFKTPQGPRQYLKNDIHGELIWTVHVVSCISRCKTGAL